MNESNLKGVALDTRSFDRGDIDLSPLNSLPVEWTWHPSTTPDQASSRVEGCQIVITNKVVVDRSILDANPQLQLVLIAATGTDNVDVAECTHRDITVCNVRHYATPAVVQHTIALMLNLLTSQPRYIDDVSQGAWQNSDVFCLLDHPILEVEGKTLGIVGYGTLGQRVAEVGRALGMEVVLAQRPGTEPGSDRLPFDEFLETCDVISLHCPLNENTRNLFSEQEFRKMKSSAFIINTARGAIIDSVALINALEQGEIGGAGIDVLDREPPVSGHPLVSANLPNLLVTPHNAWGTRESRQRLVNILGSNLEAWLNHSPENVVQQ